MAAAHILHLRHYLCTLRLRIRASCMKAPAGGLIGLGISPSMLLFTFFVCELWIRDRNAAESLRIRMQRMLIESSFVYTGCSGQRRSHPRAQRAVPDT